MIKSIALLLVVSIATVHAQADRPCRSNCQDIIGAGSCADRDCETQIDFFLCERTCGGCTVCADDVETCDRGCRDTLPTCGIFTSLCHDGSTMGIAITFSLCRAHCQVCTACTSAPAAPTQPACETAEECRDDIATERCESNSRLCGSRNARFTRSCRRTCGVCQVCPLPPTPVPCRNDCRDINPLSICTRYTHVCGDSTYQLFTSRCEKTCGVCTLCEPTPRVGQIPCDECVDQVPSCQMWSESGYCDPALGYANVARTCPRSCGMCRHCPSQDKKTC